jgi:transcriptional regulator with XRE-family HTH domain
VTDADIGARLRYWRLRLGWTQADLAHRVGFTRASITNIEAGRQRLYAVDALTICRLFDIEISQLLGDAGVAEAWVDVT